MTSSRRQTTNELQEARLLYETTKEICSRLDLEETLGAICRRARQLLNGDVAYLATRVPGVDVLRMRAFDGVRTARFMALDLPYGFGLGGLVAARRGPVSTDDYVGDPDLVHSDEVDGIVDDEGLRSVLGVPVEFEEELLGVLFVATRRRRHFTGRQRTLLSSLGNSAAIAIHNAQVYEELKGAMTIHASLMELVLTERGLPAIASTLAGLIGGPVLLLDAGSEPLASAPHDGRVIPSEFDRAALSVTPITVADAVEGYIVVEERPPVGSLSQVALEQASTVFALELAKLRSADMAALHLRGDLLDQLLADAPLDERTVLRQATRLGHQLSGPQHVAVARVRSESTPSSALHNRLLQVAASLERRRRPASLVAWRTDALVMLIPGAAQEDAVQAAQELVREARALAAADLVAGVSGVCGSLPELKAGYSQALAAAGAAASLSSVRTVVAFEELGFRRAVLGTRPAPELVRLAQGLLGGLLDGGRPRAAQLLPALRAYLVAGGSLEAAARATGVHVNTMRYRIDRAAAILGRDLRDPEMRVDLLLALDVISEDVLPR